MPSFGHPCPDRHSNSRPIVRVSPVQTGIIINFICGIRTVFDGAVSPYVNTRGWIPIAMLRHCAKNLFQPLYLDSSVGGTGGVDGLVGYRL
jgi:hypothetical protein